MGLWSPARFVFRTLSAIAVCIVTIAVPASSVRASGDGSAQPRSWSDTLGFVERLCGQPDGVVCLGAALTLITLNDFERAEPLALRSCDEGDAVGCMLAGLAGSGQGKLDMALDGYGRACDGGVAAACPMLGDMLILGVRAMEPGWSFERGWSEALVLFERACDLDDGYGCRRAATVYGGGLGVPRQPERSAELRRKACELGDDEACSPRD